MQKEKAKLIQNGENTSNILIQQCKTTSPESLGQLGYKSITNKIRMKLTLQIDRYKGNTK